MSDLTPNQNKSLMYLLQEHTHYTELTETSGIENCTTPLQKEGQLKQKTGVNP